MGCCGTSAVPRRPAPPLPGTIHRAFQHHRDEPPGKLKPLCANAPTTVDEAAIVCGHCGHPVTREQARTSVGGSHVHRFANPHGIQFEIGCFSEAGGCYQIGPPTEAHTWFKAHAWRIALCGGCGIHLGWGFHSRQGGRFYGLILERLAYRA